jgi:hypothetical protein
MTYIHKVKRRTVKTYSKVVAGTAVKLETRLCRKLKKVSNT